MPYITDEINPESFYQGFSEPDKSGDDNTLTIGERLAIIEEVELARAKAEDAMSRLKPISMEIRRMKVTI